MGCVNKSSKEFKDLSARHNVDSNTLELIVHKYWMETGNETLFPTDVYIQAQLGNTQYQEDGVNVRKLWEKHYSSAKLYPSYDSLMTAYKEATKYFPKSAIVYYKNAKGIFVLSVKRPVKRINHNRKEYFEKADRMAATEENKTLHLGIKENQTYTIEKAEQLYYKFNTDKTSQDLANKVFKLAKDLGISVSFNDDFKEGKVGRYNNVKGITYKKSFLENDMMNNRKAPVLLHEVLHAISMYALSDNMEGIELSEPMRKFRVEMNSLYQDLKNNPKLRNEIGTLNVREFVAELGNPVFRAKIQEIDKQNKGKKSFWRRVLDAFKSLFNLHVTNSYYERSMNALDKAISAFDIDSYMRYTGSKNHLRQETVNNSSDTQLNKRIDVIKDAAESGKWTDEALNELNNLTKDLEDGKITYQRFPKEAARGWHQGGRANEIASILLGANKSTSEENPRSFAEKYERDKREQPIQERIIESWAKAEGIWYDKLDSVKGKEKVAEGGEAKVYHNGKEENVTKILSTEYFITPQFALDRITLHNTLFPTAPLKVIGFGRNSKGEFQFLVEQPFVQGKPATQEEINGFMTKAGFEKSKQDKGNTFISDDLYLSDLHDENVIKTPKGIFVVIDADLRLNTPDLNRNGKYNINNSIDFTDSNAASKFIRTLSPSQLDEERKLIKQEEADYNLVNGIEGEPQKRTERTGPQDFTFNDGTTIKAPFRPNAQQIDALNVMSDFIKSDETSMTLSGYAGTGKTSLMEMIAKKCEKDNVPVKFCATTNKAASVLNDRVSKAGFEATTLNKTFGINVEVDPNSKSYNARNLVNKLKDVDITPGTTVIIDEASMINEENYKILNDIARMNGLKIIYVGDSAQLPPVKEKNISKVFRNGDGKVVTLTQVERTDDNAILKEATDIRNDKPLSGESSFNGKGEGVAYIKPQNKGAIDDVIRHFADGLRNDPNYFRILAYTNRAVESYNNKVRSALGYTSPIPQVGEPVMGYDNWGYDYHTRTYRFINSESYKVTNVGKPYNKSIVLEGGRRITMEATPITVEDSFGHKDEFDLMDIKGNQQNRANALIIAEEKNRLWQRDLPLAYSREEKAIVYAKINSLANFLFVNDNIENPSNKKYLLQKKVIDFGYALTIHKSQGSTFTNVLMDDVDVVNGTSSAGMAGSAWDNVSLEDDAPKMDESNLESMSEEIDLGDLSDVSGEPTPGIGTEGKVNLRQQLEYVGVSRATDTVTIISNKVKKEDTPLHHIGTEKMSAEELESKIQDDSLKMHLSDDEKYYVDENGTKYARVTSVITTDGTRFDPNSPWGLPSSKVGTGVDVFVRDFFDGNIGDPNTLSERYPNATQEQLRNLYDDLLKIKDKIDGKYTIVSKDVTLKGQIPVVDRQGNKYNVNVAGTVDLLIYDKNGNFYIYDMKTHHSPKPISQDPNKLGRYTRQVSLYKTLFEQEYLGHTVKALALMPIHVSYPTPKGWGNGTAEYTSQGNSNQLYVNGKEFKEANPTLESTIPVTPQNVEIHYEDLDDDVKALAIPENNTINQDNNRSINKNNNGTEYKQTDEFRRVQETVRKGSQGQQRSVLGRNLPANKRQDLANVLGRQLRSINSFTHGSSRDVVNERHNTSFKIHSEVNPQLFHDIFEVVRYYADNGELVDLHDDYSDCKCYLSEDGTAGFAVEPDGNLVSVFNLGTTKGFLSAIKDLVREAGATHLDAYASSQQNLQRMYEVTLGFHTASTMDYNMEYDHDDIAKNHGNPQVVFMVDHEVENPKHFDKDSYDEAKHFQMEQVNETKKEAPLENPTLGKGNEPTTAFLPNYAIYNDYHKFDIPVDAEWKVSYLKELDDQLAYTSGDKRRQRIAEQMDEVFNATSEEEYQGGLEKRKKKPVDEVLDRYKKFVEQLDALLEGGGKEFEQLNVPKLKATEVRHVAELIANEISDEITRLQTEEGRVKEIFPELSTELDFQTATRKKIVETVGINSLISKVRELFNTEAEDNDMMETDPDMAFQADLIYDNWDALMSLAADTFAFNEGFGITNDFKKGGFDTTKAPKAGFDNFNNYSDDEDISAEEGPKDEQERWQLEIRTIDTLNSMSALVRQALHECYKLDADGKEVLSKWGIKERVNPRKATNSLLRWTQGSLSLDDMVSKLSDKQQSNPWLSQLISKLNDKSGKQTDLQSQFYSVFSKHFQAYSIVLQEDGKYYSMPVNSHPALKEVMDTITSMYKIGEHSLFRGSKINSKLLGSKDTASSDFTLFGARKALEEINAKLSKKMPLDAEMSKTVLDNVMGVCKVLGFTDVTEDMLTDAINKENISTWANNLRYITMGLSDTLAQQEKGKMLDYDPFAYGDDNNIRSAVMNFLAPVVEKLEDVAVSAFYDSGKMYQSYVTPSFMTKLLNKFHQGDRKKFEEFMMDEYGSSEWYAIDKFGDYSRVRWRNEWLRKLAKDENARKVFAHKVELNFNKHNYMRNMSDAEYTLSLLTEYYSESKEAKDMAPAWFRIPMLSNKPSSEFIRFYSHRGMNYKEHIVSELHDIFLQELSRIQTVRMRNYSKGDKEFIKNFDTNGRKFCFLPILNAYLENTSEAKAQRESLQNGVEYDTDRLQELTEKNDAWNEERAKYQAWEDEYLSYSKGFDLNSDKEKDPVIQEEKKKLAQSKPTAEEESEFNDLKKKRDLDNLRIMPEENDRLAELLQKKLAGEETLSPDEEVELSHLVDKVLRKFMEDRTNNILEQWKKKGILEAAKNIKGIYPNYVVNKEHPEYIDEYVRDQVENYIWNDALASKNILQLTIGDIAFYKDTEDLQKRLAQLHAPGMRGRIDATDYEGNRVSDGKYRTTVLKDFDAFKSNIIANISEVFDRKIAAAPEHQKDAMKALKESLVGKDGKYTRINVADAQGYSSPASYRKKAFIFGRWSHDAEKVYLKILKGDYTMTDLEIAFQPLKPFVYSRLTKDMGVDGAPIRTMKVPFQAKNAEYLLIMADALLKGEKLSRPNLLRAVYRVMEDSERLNPTMGIDTVQFESAIKSGLQNPMDISQFLSMEYGEEKAYTYMMNQIYKEQRDKDGNRIYKDYDTDTTVHETSYEDYCLQQEVPEHFKMHSQAHGSQIRMIIPSDLDFYTNEVDENGNQEVNYYEWTEPDGTHRKVTAKEFRKEYEDTIAENIEDSINTLEEELHLNGSKKERNIALSKILLNEIRSSPRYGIDLALACSIDSETGDFKIPKGDPIQAKRIEQLLNSIIKNRVNKQKIAGGPIVQVSNFGTSQQLHIRFNDKKGNLIPLEEEYEASKHKGLSYKDYLKENQGGIAYFEVFCPLWDDRLYEKFADEDGNINVDAINTTDPELLKMVSYRIPTEDKYSCAPMKVVGFMPREAGDAIMLPYELTEIDDSDFDVDKRYVMRKDIPIKTKKRKDIEDELFKRLSESYKKAHDNHSNDRYIGEQVRMFMDNPQRMKNTDPIMKWLYKQYQYIAYETEAPTSGRTYRDNKIVDMTYAALTNQMTADKILNPGGFDAPKKTAYLITAYKRLADQGYKWDDLKRMSTDELKAKSYQDKDLTFADTQVQFYKQNSAAASLIGVFAVNKVAHAILESNNIYLDVLKGGKPFVIADTVFGGKKIKDSEGKEIIVKDEDLDGRMLIDEKLDQNGNFIGKTLGSLVSASADAVKDPILNLMNINMTTAGMLNTMLRLGMSFDDAALFLSQDIIGRLLDQFNRENLSNYVTLDSLIGKWMDSFMEKHSLDDTTQLNSEEITRDELIEGLTSGEHDNIDYKVLLAFQKLRGITDDMRNITFATRFNSISSAVGPLIVDNLIIEKKMQDFTSGNRDTNFYQKDDEYGWMEVDIDDVFADHPILKQFSRTVDIAKNLFSDMPTGSTGFRELMNKLPKDISEKMYKDKKLLDQFSLFYQSYLLIQSGVMDPTSLKHYVTEFPKEFIDKEYKKKYPDNALVQAIRMNIDKKSGRPYLQINITGMDEQQKEELKYAWIDLHKDNPKLSQDLFNYSFFRGGIGFSPKTFMALVPMLVKEELKGSDGKSSYVNTYRNFPTVIPELVIDQFIRNNWNNTKLVPWRGGKDTHYNVDVSHGRLTAYYKEDMKDLEDVTYIKTKNKNGTYLWHKIPSNNDQVVFELLKPLGNNGEYLEMGLHGIEKPLSTTLKAQEDNTASELDDKSPMEDATGETPSQPVSSTEELKGLEAIADLIQRQRPDLTMEEAIKKANDIKDSGINLYKGFLVNVFKHKGLELNEKQAIEEFKKYC